MQADSKTVASRRSKNSKIQLEAVYTPSSGILEFGAHQSFNRLGGNVLDIFQFFTSTSLWGIALFTCFIVFLAFEGGVFLGKKHRAFAEPDDRSPIGSIVGAALGLLAFFLAFTFGIAASKFDARRELVIEEANAIGTTYLRAGYLEERHKIKIRNLLQEYVNVRLEAVNPGKLKEGIKKSEEIQTSLWEQAVAIAKQNPNSVVDGLFIQSLNQVIDLHEKRIILGAYFRIPFVIWGTLYFVTTLAIGALGYQIGLTRTNYLGISILLIITFSSVITLIVDLDRPQEGFIKVSQQSLINLQEKLQNS